MPTIKELLRLRTPAPVVEPTPDELARHDEEVRRQQEEYSPLWQGAEKVMRGGMGLIEGATGMKDFVPGAPTLEDKTNALGQLLTSGIPLGKALGVGAKALEAGLPFAAYKNKLPIKALAHGSPVMGKIERFNPALNDKSDVLGWLTHAAEEPGYANSYAEGMSKHSGSGERRPAGVFPLELGAKNVLDLVDPNVDDIAHVIQALPRDSSHRKMLIETFKDARRYRENYPDQAVEMLGIKKTHHPEPSIDYAGLSQQAANDLMLPTVKNSKFKTDVELDWPSIQPTSPEQIESILNLYSKQNEKHLIEANKIKATRSNLHPNLPAIAVSEKLQLQPEQFDKTLFDAIRYNDVGNKSWAWPETTPVKSKFGADLTPVPNQSRRPSRFIAQPDGQIRNPVQEESDNIFNQLHGPDEWMPLEETPLPPKETFGHNAQAVVSSEAYAKQLGNDVFFGKITPDEADKIYDQYLLDNPTKPKVLSQELYESKPYQDLINAHNSGMLSEPEFHKSLESLADNWNSNSTHAQSEASKKKNELIEYAYGVSNSSSLNNSQAAVIFDAINEVKKGAHVSYLESVLQKFKP